MKVRYEVVGFAQIKKTSLKKHSAADLPMAPGDKGALKSSIDERGIIQPLLVLEKPDDLDGAFLVVDGCNRLDSAAADAELPCVMIRTDDPRAVALECLGTGRQRSTGQRILAFLLMHKKEVLKAAELGKSEQGGKLPPLSRESGVKYGVFADFTTLAISERLKVCQEDVVRAVELFRCVEERRVPAVGVRRDEGERTLDMGNEDDVETFKLVVALFNKVLAGGSAIRDWKRSYGGKDTTKGGRPDIKYTDLTLKGLNHLKTVFKSGQWHNIPSVQRDALAEIFDQVIGMLPDELRVRLPKEARK